MNGDVEVLVDVAVLGKQVQNFFDSDIGKFLLHRAKMEYDGGIKALKQTDPTDTRAIIVAQNAVWRAESIKDWLDEAILAGLKAEVVLEDREDD